MKNIRLKMGFTQVLLTVIATIACVPHAANAIPAFANRLGVPCKTCHEPVFPRLNRTG
jgi:hypothetical protein